MKVKVKMLTAIALSILIALISGRAPLNRPVQAQIEQDKVWITRQLDVDWDSHTENARLVINDGTVYTFGGFSRSGLWRAPFLTVDFVPRVTMAIEDLREQVYWGQVLRLDEGWWDESGGRRDYIFDSKATIQTLFPSIQTTWTHSWTGSQSGYTYGKSVTLVRNVAEWAWTQSGQTFHAFVVAYEIKLWYDPNINDNQFTLPWLAARVGFGIMLHANLYTATSASDALAAMVSAMSYFQTNVAPSYNFKGVLDQNVTFVLSYTFDDVMKKWSNGLPANVCILGWDGSSPNDFQAASPPIDYEDDQFSPLTPAGWQADNGLSSATFGMVYVPASWRGGSIWMDNGFFNSTHGWVGVGPTGNEGQRAYIVFRITPFPTDVNGDGKDDMIDMWITQKHFGEIYP